jgi:D-alanyl-D-alanine carboxypeptidase
MVAGNQAAAAIAEALAPGKVDAFVEAVGETAAAALGGD